MLKSKMSLLKVLLFLCVITLGVVCCENKSDELASDINIIQSFRDIQVITESEISADYYKMLAEEQSRNANQRTLIVSVSAVFLLLMMIILIIMISINNKTNKTAIEAAQVATFAMFDANPHINVLFNSRLEVIDCNTSALGYIGFKTKEEMRANFAERVTKALPKIQPDGRITTSLKERLMVAVKKGVEKFETELHFEDRRLIIDVEFRKIPYEGSFAIICYAHDITDMRRRELELKKAHVTIEQQLSKLNLILKATQIALWEMYVTGNDPINPENEGFFSDEFRNMLGYSNEIDFPNIISSWSEKLHPEDKEKAVNAFLAHMLDKTGNTPFNEEYRLLKKNGEYSYFRAHGEAIRDNDGNPIYVAGALMDITEEKNILLNTEKLRQEAEVASKSKSSFLSNMSHEMRTPMNAIIGMTIIGKKADDIACSIANGFAARSEI